MFPVVRSECQVTEIKLVNWKEGHEKRGDPKNEGISLDVIENKGRKNVSLLL
jgi:hypothetical protein